MRGDRRASHSEVASEGQHAAAGRQGPVHSAIFIVFAAVYVLLTIGWGLIVARNDTQLGSLGPQLLYLVGLGLALAAAPLWFICATFLARTRGSRVVWMLTGLVVLMPWPVLIELS